MGPIGADSVLIETSIELGSRPWTARKMRVPLHLLSKSMQSIHNRGMRIHKVDLLNLDSVESQQKVKTSMEMEPSQEPSKKAAKRGGRRRRK